MNPSVIGDPRREYAEGGRVGGGLSIRASNANSLYQQVLAYLIGLGRSVAPRGEGTIELKATTLVLENSRRNVVTLPERNLNYVFSVAEWLWILLGRDDVASITHFNQGMLKMNLSDDGKTYRGAYGLYLAEHKQLDYVLHTLRRDGDSRQAVITMWRPSPAPSRDIPCTLTMQFLLRDDRLHAHVTMRSNDVWLGLPYDLFNFTQLQATLAAQLDVYPGEYYHTVGSLHLYERDRQKAYFVKAAPTSLSPESPILSPLNEDDLTRLNSSFQAIVVGGEVGEELPEPWKSYLDVLAYRNHKDAARVSLEPYRSLLAAKAAR